MADAMKHLKYWHPVTGEVVDAGAFREEEWWYYDWLTNMVNIDLDVIWFVTIETTDIFDEGPHIVNHSCSCHTKEWGPCTVCRTLGCEVWDFNQVRWLRETDSVIYHDDIPMVLRRDQQKPEKPSGDDPRAGHEIPPLM